MQWGVEWATDNLFSLSHRERTNHLPRENKGENELVGKSITLEYKQEQRTIFISETTLYDNDMHTCII